MNISAFLIAAVSRQGNLAGDRPRIPLIIIISLITGFIAGNGTLYGQDRESLLYIILMKSGDSFRGNLVGYTDSTVTLLTEFDSITIGKELVREFIPVRGPYTRRPQHFLMPSASAIGSGGFISNYELGFLYGGVGIGSVLTLTGGMTVIPGISLSSQFFHTGVKITVRRNIDPALGGFEAAVGFTGSWLTTSHGYGHVYAVGSFDIGAARVSAMLNVKLSGPSLANVALQAFNYDTTRFNVHYDGVVGLAFGMDMPVFDRDDMFWVWELWLNNMRNDDYTGASFLGIRLTNEHLSADFGAGAIPGPFFFPATNFSWRF